MVISFIKIIEEGLKFATVAGGALFVNAAMNEELETFIAAYAEIGVLGVALLGAIFLTRKYIDQQMQNQKHEAEQSKRDDTFREREARRHARIQMTVARTLELQRQDIRSLRDTQERNTRYMLKALKRVNDTTNANTRVLAGVIENQGELKDKLDVLDDKFNLRSK